MKKQIGQTKVTKLGNKHGVYLNTDALKTVNINDSSKLRIVEIILDGKKVLALEPISEPTLAEKYASYTGTPESYQDPQGLKDWANRKPVGKELWP